MALDRTGRKRQRVEQVGMRAYLRMPDDLELFGDCGAFGYIEEREPIFSTEDVLEYYHRLGFDYGVSVDHIVLPEFAHQRSYRYKLTLRNAEDFLRMHRDGELGFTPVGAAQGWDERTYVEAAEALVGMGYEYIALGGLVRSSTKEISRIVTAVSDSGKRPCTLACLRCCAGVVAASAARARRDQRGQRCSATPGVAGREGQLLHGRRGGLRRHPDSSGNGGPRPQRFTRRPQRSGVQRT